MSTDDVAYRKRGSVTYIGVVVADRRIHGSRSKVLLQQVVDDDLSKRSRLSRIASHPL